MKVIWNLLLLYCASVAQLENGIFISCRYLRTIDKVWKVVRVDIILGGTWTLVENNKRNFPSVGTYDIHFDLIGTSFITISDQTRER